LTKFLNFPAGSNSPCRKDGQETKSRENAPFLKLHDCSRNWEVAYKNHGCQMLSTGKHLQACILSLKNPMIFIARNHEILRPAERVP
jgi:hypothetical protein